MIIKWLICSVFSINIAQAEFFVSEILAGYRSILQNCRGQVNIARADYIIDHHPAPSWTVVANALWYWTAAGALEIVQKLYLKGEPCVHSCRSEGRKILSVSELALLLMPLAIRCILNNFRCVQRSYCTRY